MRRFLSMLLMFASLCRCEAATFYIANSGSDSNTSTQAQSKSTPWAHLPGMPSCTASCAAYTPQPGDHFILRGGDIWHKADLGVDWIYGGSSGSPSYIGVDKTWFSGGTWTQPTFTCDGDGTCASNTTYRQLSITNGTSYNSYVKIDNIRFTGLFVGAYPSFTHNVESVYFRSKGVEVANILCDGFSHDLTSPAYQSAYCVDGDGSNGTDKIADGYVHDSVCDGSNTKDMGVCFQNIHRLSNNVMRYVTNGGYREFDIIDGNLVEHSLANYVNPYLTWSFNTYGGLTQTVDTLNKTVTRTAGGSGSYVTDGVIVGAYIQFGHFANSANNAIYQVASVSATVLTLNDPGNALISEGPTTGTSIGPASTPIHCDGIFQHSPLTGTITLAWGNVVRNMEASAAGFLPFWLVGNISCPTCVTYAWNNVTYGLDTADVAGITIGGHATGGATYGTFYLFNNTMDAGPSVCMGNGETGPRMTLYAANNHCIITTGQLAATQGLTFNNVGGNLVRTRTQAASDCSAGTGCYVSTDTYAYSPKPGGDTIAAGLSQLTLVADGFNPSSPGSLGFDTSFANQRTPDAWPLNTAFPLDVGAYQFTISNAPPLGFGGPVSYGGF